MRPVYLTSGPGPALEDGALRLDQQVGQQVCVHRGSGSDAGVVPRDQGRGNGETELVESSRRRQITHEKRTAFTQNSPQPSNSQSVQCCWQVDVRVSRDDHVVFTQCASGTIDCLSGGTLAGD